MLLQLHWQFKNGVTRMRAQRDFTFNYPISEMQEWVRDIRERHPLPEGAIWMMCDKKSRYFVGTIKEGDE